MCKHLPKLGGKASRKFGEEIRVTSSRWLLLNHSRTRWQATDWEKAITKKGLSLCDPGQTTFNGQSYTTLGRSLQDLF